MKITIEHEGVTVSVECDGDPGLPEVLEMIRSALHGAQYSHEMVDSAMDGADHGLTEYKKG